MGNWDLIKELDIKDLTHEEFIRLAYMIILLRPVDDVGLSDWLERARSGEFSRSDLINTLVNSPEFKMVHNLPFHQIVHEARKEWIISIPPFKTILDIGGLHTREPMGAMISMGYKHRPDELVILDLPDEDRLLGGDAEHLYGSFQYSWGTIHYIRESAEDLKTVQELREKKFHCIHMGQVLEHIRINKVAEVLKWIRDHLAPGGQFVFDTPNRLVTVMHSPDRYVDGDHKYEYNPEEVSDLLGDTGFQILYSVGILHMPLSYRTGKFNPMEAYEAQYITDDLEASYLLGYRCAIA